MGTHGKLQMNADGTGMTKSSAAAPIPSSRGPTDESTRSSYTISDGLGGFDSAKTLTVMVQARAATACRSKTSETLEHDEFTGIS